MKKMTKAERLQTREMLLSVHQGLQSETCGNQTFYTWCENDKFIVRAFNGSRSKSFGYYAFKTEEQRTEWIDRYKAQENRVAEQMKEYEGNYLKLGDILKCSWGYDQTNIDFYQVLEVKKASVIIAEIASKTDENKEIGWCSRYVVPVKDHFVSGNKMIKRVKGKTVKITNYAWASLWDGKPANETSYA